MPVAFVKHHAAAITSIVVNVVVMAGCEATLGAVTAGAATMACSAIAGAVSNAAAYAVTAAQTGHFSWAALGKTSLEGAAMGLAMGGLGELAGAAKSVLGSGVDEAASALSDSAVDEVGEGAANAAGETTADAARATSRVGGGDGAEVGGGAAGDSGGGTSGGDAGSGSAPEDRVDLYHGTSQSGASNIAENGVDPSFAPRPRDFGNGFYTTRSLAQTAQWAARKFGSEAAVLHFSVPAEALNSLDSLSFDADSPGLPGFLRAMRGGGSHGYEMVEGPMLGNPGAFAKGAEPDLWGNQVAFFGNRAAGILDESLVGKVP